MDLEVGAILTGKVTGITKFGAFVTVAPGKSGLVHISEISNTYVNDVHDHLTEGQDVSVKVVGVDQSGRLNLSIKAASSPPPPPPRRPAMSRPQPDSRPQASGRPPQTAGRPPASGRSFAAPQMGEPTFEDKLKRFMQDSDNKMSGLKQYSDKRPSRRRGK